MIIFPWKKKKIEKAISLEVRQKCKQGVIDFNCYKKTKLCLQYYVVLQDGTMLLVQVNPSLIGKSNSVILSGALS